MNISELSRPHIRLDPIEGNIFSMGDTRKVNLRTGGTAEVCNATLRDNSGSIELNLWDSQIKMVKPGTKIRIENGYVTTFKGKNSLSIGKY